MSAARTIATYQDVLDTPASRVAEVINGALITSPRPAAKHASAATILGAELEPPFRRKKGGPGGWIILNEPELHVGADILVPDLAGWRRERMPELPDVAYFTIAPNWICEVLSPSTAAYDRTGKLPIYAAHGVAHAWLIDPDAMTLEVFRLDGATYRMVLTFSGNAGVRAEPFDAIELSLGELWQR